MSEEEPKIRIETREELIYLLAEAAAIEHNVMCCYLYGIWSLKRGEQDGLSPEQAKVVQGWKLAMTAVAVEEMSHLTLVGNLATSIGAAPHLSRPDFPIPSGYHPEGVSLELLGFSHALIDHGIFLERPEGMQLRDAPEFVHPSHYHRTTAKGSIMPSAQDYLTIGHLYRGIMHGFEVLSNKIGEDKFFCGEISGQISPVDAPLPGLSVVTDLASAEVALETIINQGEGAPEHSEDSHYQKFLNLRDQLDEMLSADPTFEPAFPVARNPVMQQPIDNQNRVYIDDPDATKVLELANSIYGHMLRALVQSFGRESEDGDNKRLFLTLARELMSVLTPVCEHLASLPASPTLPGVNAGMTFTMLRDVARIPGGASEMRMMSERFIEIAEYARTLFPQGHALDGISDTLVGMASKIDVPGLKLPVETIKPDDDKPKVTEKDEETVGRGEGRDMVLSFDTRLCVHAAFCSYGAPKVFLRGVKGQWIFPDAMETDAIRGVVHNCPSGAISYVPKGDTLPEPAPAINTVNLRENGPYAFRAPMSVNGEDVGFRAALCRCGESKNKPFCDGTHLRNGFKATGEPDSSPYEPLEVEDGPVTVLAQKNGPLLVSGNLDICSGTGRSIKTVQSARLCRCGGSKTKPFCDNTHLKIGFKAN